MFIAFLPLLMLTARADAPPPPTFVEISRSAGIDFQHRLGDVALTNIVESSGSGCASFDYDSDGWIDLYLVNCSYTPPFNEGPAESGDIGATNRLYRNLGNGKFADVTAVAGVGDDGYGMGCVAGDIDNDGDSDLYVSNYGRNTLYRNNGDGTFADMTVAAGVGDTLGGTGCAFLDYDRDGFLDLFVGNYLDFDPGYRLHYAADEFPGPLSYLGQRDLLYHNKGDGTFEEVGERAGVAKSGRAMGTIAADYDADGWIDIFVANDAMQNYLYRNNGDGTFSDVAFQSGVALSANGDATSSMGGDFGDFDNDGDFDLLVPDMAFNNLYVNVGGALFKDATAACGLAQASGQYISWGGDFGDFDNDGFLDILLSTGDNHRLDTMEPLLLLNLARGASGRVFRDLREQYGPWFRRKMVSRGLSVADHDNDGDLDLLVVNLDRPSHLVRNDGGNAHHWLAIRLEGSDCNRDGIGAIVTVCAGELKRTEQRISGGSYLSENDPRLHFGLGTYSRIDEIVVGWPCGARQSIKGVDADRVLVLKEPAR